MVASLATDSNDAGVTLAAAREYLAAGFSIIPLDPDPKGISRKRPHPLFLPGRKWGEYQLRRPTDAELVKWFSSTVRGGPPGIGIISGPISGGLVTADIDDPIFSTWLEEQHADDLLKLTWTRRSGSGLIHLPFYSEVPVNSQKYHAGGMKIGDIRGWGQGISGGGYVVAPPSLHPNGGRYVTLYGSPQAIAHVKDGNDLLARIADLYSGYTSGVRRLASADMTILPPVEATQVQALVVRIQALSNQKVKRAILNGANAGSGEWTRDYDNSGVDYGVICGLLEEGWEREDIHAVYRSLPIGEMTYRNNDPVIGRPHHGESYFDLTYENCLRGIERQVAAAKIAAGTNFTVVKAIHQDFDGDPVYVMSLEWFDKTGSVVRINAQQFDNDRSFRNAVWAQTRKVPDFSALQMGQGFFNFKGAVGGMAVVEEAPDDATVSGHIKSIILRTLKTELRDHAPDDAEQFSLGWCEAGQQWAYIRGPVLIARVQALIHSAKPDSVWKVLRGLGGRTAEVLIGVSQEQVWTLPANKLR